MQLDFNTMESKVFKFYIPSNAGVKDVESQIKAVTITAAPFLPTAENILLSASTKPDVIPTSASRKGVPGWRKGQTLRLSDQHKEDWCTDCYVTILVDIQDAGKYYIMAKTNVGIMQIHQEKKVDDVAFFGERTCYKYYVQDAFKTVQVRVQQYSGLISYAVNPRTIPLDQESAAYKTIASQNSLLKISKRERQLGKASMGLYYICVFPHMTSTFTLLVTEYDPDQTFTTLDDGYDQNGEL